jgi:Flp pilus assembly protein TadD
MHCLAPRRRFADARDRLARAQELDPLSPAIAASAGMLHAFEGNPAAAIEQYRQVLERHPGFGPAHYFHGLACIQLDRYAEAIEALTLAATLTAGSPEVDSALAMAHGRAGHGEPARTGLARLLAKAATRYVSPVLIAQVHLGLADFDAALAALEHGLAVHASEMALLEVRTGFEALRGVARFRCLIEAVAGAGR